MSDYTTKLHRLGLDSLRHICQGRLAEQVDAAVEQLDHVADNLDGYQTSSGAAKCKLTITLDLAVSPDGIEISALCDLKTPKRKALRDSARRHGGGYAVTEECMVQERLPLRNVMGE